MTPPPATSEATRHSMQANKSKNTKPELKVRQALRQAGLSGYRLHWKKAPGKPDVCYPGRRVAIFVNGCYWHRCPHCALPMPRHNAGFWEEKFARNQARDARDQELLRAAGWTVVVIWECELNGARFDSTMRSVVEIVRRAGAEGQARRRAGRVIHPAAANGWHRREAWQRLSAR